MPERIFKYHTTAELLAGVKELGKAIAGGAGAIKQLRNSNTGFLVETAALRPEQIRDRFMAARYEIYLRGKGVDGKDAVTECADLEACDPYREKKMRICTVHC